MIAPPIEVSQDLILVGGGHSHVLALRMLAMKPVPGVRITLISPASHSPYSGMLPGLVAGHYRFEQSHIDLVRLCQWAGVRFLAAEVVAIDPEQKLLKLKGRPDIYYDLVSLDIGSEPDLDSVPGAREWATPVKPVAQLWGRWEALIQQLRGGESAGVHRIAVVGGGAGSVELVMAMAHSCMDLPVQFELICGASEVLSGYNDRARRSAQRALARLTISLHLEARVISVEKDSVTLDNYERLPFVHVFWCTAAAAAPWLAVSGLQTDARGFVQTRDTLQSVNYDTVFATGDIATQTQNPRPKAGVYAVRQGPVLAANLRAFLLGSALHNHSPQRRFLSLLSLGGKNATADRSLFSATGSWVWRWKDRIDRKFMRQFEELPKLMPAALDAPNSPSGSTAQMPCGGCGAKLGAGSLHTVLSELAGEFPQYCPDGGQAEDVAGIPNPGGLALVQSIDVLREMVSDPWLMGRIAANHALSDLYASGATPISALATITLPFAQDAIQVRELKQLLAGAVYEFAAVDCSLRGGHTLQGQELNIGFVVNGSLPGSEAGLLSKSGLEPGNRLVLTKPLGTGALFAAHMQLIADGRHVHNAVESMLQSNAAAGKLALEYGAAACTDVTGFGLLGHLLEMLSPGLGVQLCGEEIPLLAGAYESVSKGVLSSMHEANAQAKEAIGETAAGNDPVRVDLLVDPQTSGGLLIGIAADKSQALCSALRSAGYDSAAIIGEVTTCSAGSAGPIKLT